MSDKKIAIVLSVLVIGMMSIVFATTYSYFSSKIDNKNGIINVSASDFNLTIANDVISTNKLLPEYDSKINSSNKVYNNSFIVSRNDNSTVDICYNLKLIIDQIGTNLASMSSFIKYQISDGINTVNGTLSSTSEKILFTNQRLTTNNISKTYNVKVWLSYNDDINQTQMLESSVSSDRQLKMHLVADSNNLICN